MLLRQCWEAGAAQAWCIEEFNRYVLVRTAACFLGVVVYFIVFKWIICLAWLVH